MVGVFTTGKEVLSGGLEVEVEVTFACCDVLCCPKVVAAELRTRGWGRLESLVVRA